MKTPQPTIFERPPCDRCKKVNSGLMIWGKSVLCGQCIIELTDELNKYKQKMITENGKINKKK